MFESLMSQLGDELFTQPFFCGFCVLQTNGASEAMTAFFCAHTDLLLTNQPFYAL
jgi:hypothetical protein